MNLLQKQGFYNSIILYAGTALGFFNMIILFQRVLTIEEIGFFSLMTAVTGLYAQIASVGINNIIFKYFPYYRTEDKTHGGFITFVIIWCSISFILFSILFYLFQHSIIAYYDGQKGAALLVKYFYLLMPLAFLTMTYTVIESMAITVFKNVLSSFLREVVLRLFTLIAILLMALSIIKYQGFLSIYFAANCLIILALWLYVYRGKDFKLIGVSPSLLKQRGEFFKYGIFTLLSGTSFALIQSLDNIMLSAITKDLQVVGVYSTFFAMALVISLPAKALNRTSLQIIAQAWAANDVAKISKIYYKTSVIQMLIGCLLFIGLLINKDFIMLLLHKPQYSGYFNVFIIIGLGFLTDVTGGVNGYIINLSKNYKMTTYFIIGAVLICAIANWLLIPKMGMMGAAVAYLLAMFALNFTYWLYIKLRFNLQPFGRAHCWIVLMAVSGFLVGSYLPAFSNNWIDIAVRSCLVGVIYIVLAYMLEVSEDINIFINKMIKK
jgi:O-antigen/teichoic acid export membrane protein